MSHLPESSPPQPDVLEHLHFTDIGARGDGIAEPEGEPPVFTFGVIPGERARVRVRARKRNWVATDLLDVETPSPHRVTPRCPLFGTCSGCQLQHVAYPHQVTLKKRMVQRELALEPLLRDVPVRDVIAAKNPWNYRNHARFTVRNGELGFIRHYKRQFLKVPHCDLMDPRINDMLRTLQGRLTGQTQCNMRVGAGPEDAIVQPNLSAYDVPFASGQTHLVEQLGTRRFRVSAPAFFQVNRAQAEQLGAVVVEQAAPTPDAVVVDAYAGVGTFAAQLATHAAKVLAIEESGPATEDARQNLADLPNVQVHTGNSEELLAGLEGPITSVILDPPRSGCRESALQAVQRLRPSRVVYVSCAPSTLARDLAQMCGPEGAFDCVQIQPVDMFPHTHHVECVATLVLR